MSGRFGGELTRPEKLAGRLFRTVQQDKLAESFRVDPPEYQVMSWHRVHRHPCDKRGGVSTALELHEQYVFSPGYVVHVDGTVSEWIGMRPVADQAPWVIPDGRFGFIWKAGRCRGCGKAARSRTGRLVDAYERPPLEGRVAR